MKNWLESKGFENTGNEVYTKGEGQTKDFNIVT